MIKMKKALSLLLACLMITLCFSGCSGKTSMSEENMTDAANTAIAALKSFDTQTLEKYVESSTLSVILNYAGRHSQFTELGQAMFENLSCEIVSVNKSEKSITLSVINKDLSAAASSFTKSLTAQYSTMELLSNLNDSDWLDINLAALTAGIGASPMMSEAQEITLSIKKGEENLVLVFDEEAENAVSGGALGAIKSAAGI